MPIKEKFLGLLIIIVGAIPFLLKFQPIASFFEKYKFLSYLVPGEVLYQAIIIAFGVLLIWNVKPRVERRR